MGYRVPSGVPDNVPTHTLGSHSQATLAELNSLISGATLDGVGNPRPPTAHDLDSHGDSTLAELNAIISDVDLDAAGTARPPTAHALGAHTSSTLSTLNAIVSDATLDTNTASRPPSGAAGGDLDGSYPNPDVVALTADGTQLTLGAIADGEILVRSGSTIVGTDAPQASPRVLEWVASGGSQILDGVQTILEGLDTGIGGWIPSLRTFRVTAVVTVEFGPLLLSNLLGSIRLRQNGVNIAGQRAQFALRFQAGQGLLDALVSQRVQVAVSTWCTPGVTAGVSAGVPMRFDCTGEQTGGIAADVRAYGNDRYLEIVEI